MISVHSVDVLKMNELLIFTTKIRKSEQSAKSFRQILTKKQRKTIKNCKAVPDR